MNVLWLGRCFSNMFLFYFEANVCINCLVVKNSCFSLIIALLRWSLITENINLSRDGQLSSVTRNCQIYSMQLDTLKTGFFNLKDFLNFIIVKRNYLLNNYCSFVSPNFRFKKTRFVNFFTDPVLPNSLSDNVSILFVRHILSSDHVKWANNENQNNFGIAGPRVCLTSNIDLQLSRKWFIYIFPLS